MMRVAVVHYHLRPGGVTYVIERAVEALRPHGIRLAVLSGEPGAGASAPHAPGLRPDAVVDGLGYASATADTWPDIDPDRCRAAARDALGGDPDLWHIHNHSLGKNTALPRLVSALARRGDALVLQLHDFSEDGRPAAYRRLRDRLGSAHMATLYPVGPRIRYALLNRRDRDFLLAAGAPPERCLRLPNPVATPSVEPKAPGREALPLFLYPTRAIRRKNVGELLLWAAVHRGAARFATTLAPENPEARPVYERWKSVAAALGLPVDFGLGEKGAPLRALFGAARAVVTTSIAEGFGLAFLEPWGAGLPLVGRTLPEITTDFLDEQIRLDGMYARLDVPSAWVDRPDLCRRIEAGLRAARSAYGLPCDADDVQRAVAAAEGPEGVDFGRLDEPLQETILRRVAESAEARAEWVPETNLLSAAADQERTGRVAHNATRVAASYSLVRYGERLSTLYRELLESPEGAANDTLDPAALLRAFSDPARFTLLRT